MRPPGERHWDDAAAHRRHPPAGQGVTVGDWDIVCVLHHESEPVRAEPCVPMSERQLERLAGAHALCEACRAVRPRKQTFIVRERATGRRIQLGSSCLRQLTGTESAEDAIRRAQTLARIRTAVLGAARQPADPGEQYIETRAFLAHAVSVVRSNGFRRSDEHDATRRTALTRIERGDDVPLTVGELKDGEEVAYPSAAFNHPDHDADPDALVSVQSVVVDPLDRLWILDTGSPTWNMAGSSLAYRYREHLLGRPGCSTALETLVI